MMMTPLYRDIQNCNLNPCCFQNPKIMNMCLHDCAHEVDYLGGDKGAETCKEPLSEEMVDYKDALTDLVKAVSIAHFLGKKTEDF